jgi:hypothetical protein
MKTLTRRPEIIVISLLPILYWLLQYVQKQAQREVRSLFR